MFDINSRFKKLFTGVLGRIALGFVLVLSAMNTTPASSAPSQQSPDTTLELSAPDRVAMGDPIEITLTVKHAADIAGYETSLLFDTSAAEYGGLQQRSNDLKKLHRDVNPLTAVDLPGGVAFGLFTCPFDDCVNPNGTRNQKGGSGTLKLGTVTLFPTAPGSLEIKLDATKFVDSTGNPVAVTLVNPTIVVEVGGDQTLHPAPASMWNLPATPSSTPPGPFDLSEDGFVTNADAMEVALQWELTRMKVAPCGSSIDPTRDINHDGCIDVADMQLIAANYSDPSTTGPASRSGAPASSSQAITQATTQATSATSLTFTVNSTGEQWDSALGDGICKTSVGTCTLRAAIQESNKHSGPDTINFNIPGGGVQTIQLTQVLPTLLDTTGPTTINGYTQPGASPNTDPLIDNAVIRVQIAGAGSSNFDAMAITSSGNRVQGLAFFNLQRSIWIYGSGAFNNTIVGDFIGTDAAGVFGASATSTTQAHGLHIEQGAARNYIGDTALGDRNVISGNARSGVGFWHEATDNNVVYNNIIGLGPGGNTRVNNRIHGVDINYGSSSNLIGGTGPGQRNISSGNNGSGVEMSHTAGTTLNQVVGNYLGTDVTGTQAPDYARNGQKGVSLKDRVTNNTVSDNVIGNNDLGGVVLDNYGNCCLSGNRILNNRIGIGVNGAPIPNRLYGIGVFAGLSIIGPGNTITNNPIGIDIEGDTNDGNTITQNSIYNNAGLGIDIAPIGSVNLNDPGDVDSGPNEQLNFPVLATTTAQQVTGTACANCTVEIFVADSGANSYGEGKTFVGSAVADSSGAFTASISGANAGDYLTSTATDSAGNTSEFSLNVLIPGSPPASTTYASDGFSRTVANGWGNADTGGSYTLSGTASNFAVNGSAGTIKIPSAQWTQATALQSVSASNVDITFQFQTDKVASGNNELVFFAARSVSGNTEYRGQIRLSTAQEVFLRAAKVENGVFTNLGTEVKVAGLTHAANSYILVHAQVVGSNPTTIQMRAWANGQAEPTSWQFVVTDSTASLQTAGGVGLRATLPASVTNGPVLFTFDNFKVTSTGP